MMNRLQTYLFWVLLLFLAVGIIYPAVGVLAIVCMLAPVMSSPWRGRYWCGNFCPRGSFYDNVLGKISPGKPIPAVFRNVWFRIFMLILIMGIFSAQMYYAWGDLAAVGAVFVRIILVTTVVGIVLGLFYYQRTWCSFCPMGTLANWFSAKRKPKPLKVGEKCVDCKLCTAVCPLQLDPYAAKGKPEGFTHGDCLKCGRCIKKCPKKVLAFDAE